MKDLMNTFLESGQFNYPPPKKLETPQIAHPVFTESQMGLQFDDIDFLKKSF